MSRQSNGTYQQPAATAAVSGATISSSAYNTLITDIGTEITNSVDRGGRSAMTAALPMGGQKISGMADPAISTDGATKNYVDALAALLFSTGDVKLTLKTVADSGWIMANDGTIGNGTSNATTLANTTTAAALFSLIWTNVSNTWAPIYDSAGTVTTRGVSAAADFAASKRLTVSTVLGRALAISGSGLSLTARALGQTLGEETHVITLAEMAAHDHGGLTGTENQSHYHTYNAPSAPVANVQGLSAGGAVVQGSTLTNTSTEAQAHNHNITAAGSNTAHNNMQPTSFLNAMIRL